MGFMVANLSTYCLGGIINKKGEQLDYLNIGFCSVATMVFVNQLQVLMEYRNFTRIIVLMTTISVCMFPLIINVNDKLETSHYFGVQWSVNCSSPIMILLVFLMSFVVVIPRFAYNCLHKTVWFPEFA